jgi:putative transposase
LRNLEAAFQKWREKKARFPVFKKRGKRDSFYLEGKIRISGNRIRVPILGWLKCHEQLPATCPKSVTISRQRKKLKKEGDVIGVDLGIHNLAACSNGRIFANPKPYRKAKKRLKRKAFTEPVTRIPCLKAGGGMSKREQWNLEG